MSTISQWCRYCGVENKLDATSCAFCGRPLVALNQRQEIPQQQQRNVASQQSGERSIWRSPRLIVPLSIICLVLIVGVGTTMLYFHSKSSSVNSNLSNNMIIIWQTVPNSFTQQDQQSLQVVLESALVTSNSGTIAGHEFTIIDAQRQGEWAIFSASERVSHDAKPIPTEPVFFLAHQQGTTWTVWLPSSSDFCNQLRQVPDTLLNATDKGYFC